MEYSGDGDAGGTGSVRFFEFVWVEMNRNICMRHFAVIYLYLGILSYIQYPLFSTLALLCVCFCFFIAFAFALPLIASSFRFF